MINGRTEKEYKIIIRRYAKILKREPEEQLEYMRGEGISISTIKTNMCALKWETGDERYAEIIRNLSEELQRSKEKYKNKFAKIDWSRISKVYSDDVDSLIRGLYTMFPPRRIEDYAYMRYVDEDKGDEEVNYYVGTEGKFIFKKYKTVRTYGIQSFDVSAELKELIDRYILKNKISHGDPLLKYHGAKGKFSEKTLQRKLIQIFGASVDGIRHAYITNIYKNGKNLFNIDDISNKMAHNIKTHLGYLDKENLN